MRVGHKYIEVKKSESYHTSIDSSTEEHEKNNGYKKISSRFSNPDDFLSFAKIEWIQELHQELLKCLSPHDKILGLGSGLGEHELLLHLKGFNIIASDIVNDSFDATCSLFPKFQTLILDATKPLKLTHNDYNCVLITGMEIYFDDEQLKNIFSNIKNILVDSTSISKKKFVFAQRYNDNFFTYLIDELLLPFEAFLLNIKSYLLKSDIRYIKKQHGYRRSHQEIKELLRSVGFEINTIHYAGFGVELNLRSAIMQKVPFLMKIVKKFDKYFKKLNSVTIFNLFLPDKL